MIRARPGGLSGFDECSSAPGCLSHSPPWSSNPTSSYTLRGCFGGDLVFSGSSARKCFPQKSRPPAAAPMSDRPTLHLITGQTFRRTIHSFVGSRFEPVTLHARPPIHPSVSLDQVRPGYPAPPSRRRLAPSRVFGGPILLRNAAERPLWWEIGAKIRLTLSGSWQQGHSTAYRTVSHS